MKLEYLGRLDDFLAQMIGLNRARKISRPAWRYHPIQGLNQEIRTIIILIAEPAENEKFIRLIQRTG